MICICIGKTDFEKALEKARSEELIELRFDLMDMPDKQIGMLCSQSSRVIVKFPPGKKTDGERLEKLKTAILAGAEFVEIEWDDNEEFHDELVPFARGNDCRVIVSFLDKSKTPVKRELEQIVRDCSMMGADIVKVMCHVNTYEDNARLLSLYSLGKNIVALGLGQMGRITRIAALFAGAEFTYASLGPEIETGGGQISKTALERAIKLLRNG
jgi:3-dehydroquinate dehydratase I